MANKTLVGTAEAVPLTRPTFFAAYEAVALTKPVFFRSL
jgi:hypothetical protein